MTCIPISSSRLSFFFFLEKKEWFLLYIFFLTYPASYNDLYQIG